MCPSYIRLGDSRADGNRNVDDVFTLGETGTLHQRAELAGDTVEQFFIHIGQYRQELSRPAGDDIDG